MDDRELLTYAAFAQFEDAPKNIGDGVLDWVRDCKCASWNPLYDDAQALRLAVTSGVISSALLNSQISVEMEKLIASGVKPDWMLATRTAIVVLAGKSWWNK